MIQLISRGCASCALFYLDNDRQRGVPGVRARVHGRCGANGMSVPRTLVVPGNCPARDGVLVTTSEEHVTISDLVVRKTS